MQNELSLKDEYSECGVAMTTSEDRKEYRKSLTSTGQIAIGGEILRFISYDVSVKGIMVEVFPGKFLTDVEDFKVCLTQNRMVEIFVHELMMTGVAEAVWVKHEDRKILLGLEYRDVRHNEEKLWITRAAYRRKRTFSCLVIYEHGRVQAQGLDISATGLALAGDFRDSKLSSGDIVKLQLSDAPVKKAVAKIVWINSAEDGSSTLGLRYLEIE